MPEVSRFRFRLPLNSLCFPVHLEMALENAIRNFDKPKSRNNLQSSSSVEPPLGTTFRVLPVMSHPEAQ